MKFNNFLSVSAIVLISFCCKDDKNAQNTQNNESEYIEFYGYMQRAFEITVDNQQYNDTENFYTKLEAHIKNTFKEKDLTLEQKKITIDGEYDISKFGSGSYVFISSEMPGEGDIFQTITDVNAKFKINVPNNAFSQTFKVRAIVKISITIEDEKSCYLLYGRRDGISINEKTKPIILDNFHTQLNSYKCDNINEDIITTPYINGTTNSGGQETPPPSITIEGVELETYINVKPPILTNNNEAVFSFTSSYHDAVFQCKLNNMEFTDCTSPYNIQSLTDGSHTFMVRSLSIDGKKDITPATYTWLIDTSGLSLTLSSSPKGITTDNKPSFVIISNEELASLVCSINSQQVPCTLNTSKNGGSITFSTLGNGEYTFKTIGTDKAGNITSLEYNFIIVPNISLVINNNNPATSSTTVTLTFSDLYIDDLYVYVTNTPGCEDGGSWEEYSSTKELDLPIVYGKYTVYAKFKTDIGESMCINDSIYFIVCGDDGNSCYDDTLAKDNGFAATPTGKIIEYVYANGLSGFKVWKEFNGTRILRANGKDEWAKKLNVNGKGLSDTDFIDANIGAHSTVIGGRSCPPNVYIDDSNKFTTGNCLYYSPSYGTQRLNDAGTSQTTLGQIGLATWSSYNGGAARWYVGNINTCASRGMRLPTIFESATTTITNSNYPIADGYPTFAQSSGVPSAAGSTWSASSYTAYTSSYWMWSGSSVNLSSYDYSYYLLCVLP